MGRWGENTVIEKNEAVFRRGLFGRGMVIQRGTAAFGGVYTEGHIQC
jgi:hypothetical protein